MPKKTTFTKQIVVEAGLLQLETIGWEGFTPKKVAQQLGASTMPIFSHFPSMIEFKKAVLDRAWELLLEYSSGSYTGDEWIDQSVGYVMFARDHGRLYSCMHYGSPEEIQERRYQFWLALTRSVDAHQAFKGLSDEQIQWIRHIRSLLSHGIAISVSTEISTIWQGDEFIKRVMSMCSEILIEGISVQDDALQELSLLLPAETRDRIRGVIKDD
jgi:AcrR family transcriptional regulator